MSYTLTIEEPETKALHASIVQRLFGVAKNVDLGDDDHGILARAILKLLDRDVAALYGVETREVNQAVRNNTDKFPEGYVLRMNANEFADWKSKILISNLPDAVKASVKKAE